MSIILSTNDLAAVELLRGKTFYERDSESPNSYTLFNPRQDYVTSREPVRFGVLGEIDPSVSGIIFAGGNLSESDKASIRYWNTPIEPAYGAAYYQNPNHEYMVKLGPEPVLDGLDSTFNTLAKEEQLTEGFVVRVKWPDLGHFTDGLVVVNVGVDFDKLRGIDALEYGEDNNPVSPTGNDIMTFYVRIADIKASPTRDYGLFDIIRYEMLDYGYHY